MWAGWAGAACCLQLVPLLPSSQSLQAKPSPTPPHPTSPHPPPNRRATTASGTSLAGGWPGTNLQCAPTTPLSAAPEATKTRTTTRQHPTLTTARCVGVGVWVWRVCWGWWEGYKMKGSRQMCMCSARRRTGRRAGRRAGQEGERSGHPCSATYPPHPPHPAHSPHSPQSTQATNHPQERIRKDISEWLLYLRKSIGFDGWRFDYTKVRRGGVCVGVWVCLCGWGW